MKRNSNGRADSVPKSAIRHILSAVSSGEQWNIEQVVKAEIKRVQIHERRIARLTYDEQYLKVYLKAKQVKARQGK